MTHSATLSMLSQARHFKLDALLLALHRSYRTVFSNPKMPSELDLKELHTWFDFTCEHWSWADTPQSPFIALAHPKEWAFLASPKKTKILFDALQSALRNELSYQYQHAPLLPNTHPLDAAPILHPRHETPPPPSSALPLKITFLAGHLSFKTQHTKPPILPAEEQRLQYFAQLLSLFCFTLLLHTLRYRTLSQSPQLKTFLGYLKALQTPAFWLATALQRTTPFHSFSSTWIHFFLQTARNYEIPCPIGAQGNAQWNHPSVPLTLPLVAHQELPYEQIPPAWHPYPLSNLSAYHFATITPPPDTLESLSSHLHSMLGSRHTQHFLPAGAKHPALEYFQEQDPQTQLASTFLSFHKDTRLAGKNASTFALDQKLTLLEQTPEEQIRLFFTRLPHEQASVFWLAWLELPALINKQLYGLFESHLIGSKFPLTLLPFWGKSLGVPVLHQANRIFLKHSDRSLEEHFSQMLTHLRTQKDAPITQKKAQLLLDFQDEEPPSSLPSFDAQYAQWQHYKAHSYWRLNHILTPAPEQQGSLILQWAHSLDFLHWDITKRHLAITQKLQPLLPQELRSAPDFYLFANFWQSLRSGTCALLHSLYRSDDFAQLRFEHYVKLFSSHNLSFQQSPHKGGTAWHILFHTPLQDEVQSFFQKRAFNYLKQSFSTSNTFSLHVHWKYFSNFFPYFFQTPNLSLQEYLCNPKLESLRSSILPSLLRPSLVSHSDYHTFFKETLIPRLLATQEQSALSSLTKIPTAAPTKHKAL